MSKTLLELKRSFINLSREVKKTKDAEDKLQEIAKYLESNCSDIFKFDNDKAIEIINSDIDVDDKLLQLAYWMEKAERSIFEQSETIVKKLDFKEHESKPGITDDLDRLCMQILQSGKESYKYENIESLKVSYSQIRKKQPLKIALIRFALAKLLERQ